MYINKNASSPEKNETRIFYSELIYFKIFEQYQYSIPEASRQRHCLPKAAKTCGVGGGEPSTTNMNPLQHICQKEVCLYQNRIKGRKKEGYHWRKYSCVFTPLLTAFISSFLLSWFGFLVYWFSPGLFLPYYFCLFSKLFLNSYFDYRHSSCYFLLILNFWFFSNMIVFMFLF